MNEAYKKGEGGISTQDYNSVIDKQENKIDMRR